MGVLTHLDGLQAGIKWEVDGRRRLIGCGVTGDLDWRIHEKIAPFVIRIEPDADGFTATLVTGSHTDVRHNGMLMPPGVAHRMQAGDVLTLGSSSMLWDHAASSCAPTAAKARAYWNPDELLRLDFTAGPQEGAKAVVKKEHITFGTDSTNDYILTHDSKMARRHARLLRRDGEWFVIDLDTRSGTFLNGKPLSKPEPLHEGDLVQIGATQFNVYLPDGDGVAHANVSHVAMEEIGIEDDFDPIEARQAIGAGDLSSINPFAILFRDTTWRRSGAKWAVFLAVFPFAFFLMASSGASLQTQGFVIATYFGLLWMAVFRPLLGHLEIKPTRLLGALVAAPMVMLPFVYKLQESEPLRQFHASGEHSVLSWITMVGLVEETAKALPLLIFMFVPKGRVKEGMYLGLACGIAFGIWESAEQYLPQILQSSDTPQAFFSAALARIAVSPLSHGIWTGVVGFFAGLGAQFKGGVRALVVLGIAITAVLHGIFDWGSGSVFVLFGTSTVSVLLFVAYARTARLLSDVA